MNKLILGTGLGYGIPIADRIKIIAESGWDGFFTNWGKGEDNTVYQKLAEEYGLMYQSVHAPFTKVIDMWESEENGEKYVDEQIECMHATKDAGVDLMIAHTSIGMDKCTPTALGLRRFERIVNEAERIGVYIALENTEGEEYLEALMKEYGSSERIRFCVDTGHEMCYNGGRDMIGKYADKLISTHLNDNVGQTGEKITYLDDAHLLPFDGIIDWNKVAQRLKDASYKGELTFELTSKGKPGRHVSDVYAELDIHGFVALALERAKKFKAIMEK